MIIEQQRLDLKARLITKWVKLVRAEAPFMSLLPDSDDRHRYQGTMTVYTVLLRCLERALLSKGGANHSYIFRELIYRSFSPIINPVKLKNGNQPWQAVIRAATWLLARNDLLPEFPDDFRSLGRKLLVNLIDYPLEDKAHIYFWVRNDIPPIHQAMQLAHCAFESGFFGLDRTAWRVSFIVYEGSPAELDAAFRDDGFQKLPIRMTSFADQLPGSKHKTINCYRVGPIRSSYMRRNVRLAGAFPLLEMPERYLPETKI